MLAARISNNEYIWCHSTLNTMGQVAQKFWLSILANTQFMYVGV